MERYGRVLDSSLQVEWVVDSRPYAGPIEAILDALSDPFCNNPLQIAPVDVPWLEMDLLIKLENNIGDCKVAMPVCSGRTHPLLALIRPEVADLVGDSRRPLREQFDEMSHVLIEAGEGVVRNVNHPSDLE
jgi:molybdopterin-guanine dinucleotide biosynthesis protein A